MTDQLLESVVAAEAALVEAEEMLTILRESAGIPPADLRAAESAVVERQAARLAAYQAHCAANPGEPLYVIDQNGMRRLPAGEAQAIRDMRASAPPPRWLIPKLVIVDRLIAAGKIEAALQALSADAVTKMRWDAATAVYSDDPTALGLLSGIGADPAVILAVAA